MNFALERARKLVGGNILPASSCYPASAIPFGLSGPGATGVAARKRQPAQARRHATRQPSPKSQNAGSNRWFSSASTPDGGARYEH